MPDPHNAPAPVAPDQAAPAPGVTQAPDETRAARETDLPPTQTHEPQPTEQPDDQRTKPSAQPAAGPVSAGDPSSVFNSRKQILPPVIGPYKVLVQLGEGGMGTVYHVRHLLMEREFALKVIRAKYYESTVARERFVREIRNAFKINSDNVVQYSFADYYNFAPYLVMERLEGDTLFAWANADPGRRTVTDALRFAADLFRGLAAIHDAKLVHRDIKPGNLWVEKTGRLKVFDLGLARRYDPWYDAESPTNLSENESGARPSAVGTPRYMAPEQADRRPLTPRADLFAAGVVLYWFFTGSSPFARDHTDDELDAVRTYDPPPLSAKNPIVPAGLSELVRKLLSKSPEHRPESARAALAEVEALVAAQNAPPAQTVLLGREKLFTDALKALSAGGVVALSGEGGMGKTYVAKALAQAHAEAGVAVVWIDCAAAPRFEAVAREAAAALFADRCDTEPLEPLAARVAEQFAKRGALLVLDNYEVLASDHTATAWLHEFRAPARALCVGRTIPLELPRAQFSVTELKREHAIALFRAGAAGQANLPADVLNALCAAVGDHPLAIELLAKRATRVPVEDLLERVLRGLGPLSGNTVSGNRHTSIRACFAESLRGLSAGARELLLALSVLPAPFSPKLMTVVVDTDDSGAAAEELVGASLWRLGGTRYLVHPLVRQVAREDLGDRRPEYERRAAERIAAHVKAVRESLRGNGDSAVTRMYFGRCEAELPNILAAADVGGAPLVSIAEGLSAFWGARGHWDAAARLYARATEAARALGEPAREAWCREYRGYIFRHLGRHDEADREYRAALDVCERHPAAREAHFGRIVTRYGKLLTVSSRYDEAADKLIAGREWFRERGDREGALTALTYLGQASRFKGELDRAEELFRDALARAREQGNEHLECEVRFQLGKTYLQLGRRAEATEQLGHSLRMSRAADDGVRESQVLVDLGILAAQTEQWSEAEQLMTAGHQLARAMGLRMHEGRAMRRLAELCLARNANDDRDRARRYAEDALAILTDSEDAYAAERARETLRRAHAAAK